MIVVGNLVAGGSGKTPLVLWIAEFLKGNGWSPAIVSRGYGVRLRRRRRAAHASHADPAEVGDEPMLLARRSGCPVWVGPDRAARDRARCARSIPSATWSSWTTGCSTTVCARDLEIAVVDARGFGNGFLLPAGPLREPRSRLRSVDAVVAHGIGPVTRDIAMRLEGETLHRVTDARERRSAAGLRRRAACTRWPASATRTASSCTSRASA